MLGHFTLFFIYLQERWLYTESGGVVQSFAGRMLNLCQVWKTQRPLASQRSVGLGVGRGSELGKGADGNYAKCRRPSGRPSGRWLVNGPLGRSLVKAVAGPQKMEEN